MESQKFQETMGGLPSKFMPRKALAPSILWKCFIPSFDISILGFKIFVSSAPRKKT